jgi:hypothetical protein
LSGLIDKSIRISANHVDFAGHFSHCYFAARMRKWRDNANGPDLAAVAAQVRWFRLDAVKQIQIRRKGKE